MTALNIDPKFERKMTCAFKNDIRNLANFYQNTFESQKIWTFIGSFYPKQKMYEPKIYRRFMCHDNEEWCKIWTEIEGSVQKWYEEFNHFWLHHSKISIICTYVCLMALKIDTKFEGKMTWGILQIFTRAPSKVSKFGLLLGLFIKNRKCMSLQFTVMLWVMCHENKEWCKNWRKLDLSIQNLHEEFDDFSPKHLKI